MTTDLSQYDSSTLPSADILKRQHYAIVVADWNSEITHALAQGAIDTLIKHGVEEENIHITHVPGTVELTYGANMAMRERYSLKSVSAVIVIGCVIKGDTPHFDYVCQSVTQGVTLLNARAPIESTSCPVIFSVLTTLDKQQALDRAGGKLGNKGVEGAITAIKMANL
ncbi:MAG: 6,7-dimethyl-8-ribityllumazine synthase [Paludibacteraceae bacterium]|jgi:6,7-dimethyl-8-ribityllumazine synthase|nr:6,7-dimethyl-8-ribityllumazine synthase [Paludibacteraceae bacterium]